jgi:pimeloyl-ACP methyl ester carboxylesterase
LLVELLQTGIRTFYRAIGGTEVGHKTPDASVKAFVFDPSDYEPDRTIVLVHGLGDASTAWYRIVPTLRGHARVIAVDLPPFGLSELHDAHAIGPDEHADLLAPLIDEHRVGPTTIMGQSLGAWVTQWLLADHGEAFENAILVAPAGVRLEGAYDALELLTPHTPAEAIAYVDALWHEPPVGVRAVVGELLDRMHGPEIRGFLRLTSEDHLLTEDELGDIDTPTHVVWGQADELLDSKTPAYLAEHWGAPMDRTYLTEAGHMVHLERAEALQSLVAQRADLDLDLHLQRRPFLS